MNSQDYTELCASILKALRKSEGLTQQQIADAVGVDIKTWRHYETGEYIPKASEFMCFFDILHRDMLPFILSYLYKDTYSKIDNSSDVQSIKDSIKHYLDNVASDHEIAAIAFLIYGSHGSGWVYQLEEFLMIDHLPMSGRLAVASMVNEMYALNKKLNTLIGMDSVEPDVELFQRGLDQGRTAAHSGRNSYTAI